MEWKLPGPDSRVRHRRCGRAARAPADRGRILGVRARVRRLRPRRPHGLCGRRSGRTRDSRCARGAGWRMGREAGDVPRIAAAGPGRGGRRPGWQDRPGHGRGDRLLRAIRPVAAPGHRRRLVRHRSWCAPQPADPVAGARSLRQRRCDDRRLGGRIRMHRAGGRHPAPARARGEPVSFGRAGRYGPATDARPLRRRDR